LGFAPRHRRCPSLFRRRRRFYRQNAVSILALWRTTRTTRTVEHGDRGILALTTCRTCAASAVLWRRAHTAFLPVTAWRYRAAYHALPHHPIPPLAPILYAVHARQRTAPAASLHHLFCRLYLLPLLPTRDTPPCSPSPSPRTAAPPRLHARGLHYQRTRHATRRAVAPAPPLPPIISVRGHGIAHPSTSHSTSAWTSAAA